MKIKKEARKSAANERREVLKTGGGPATQVIKDPAMDILLDITNSKTIVELDNPVDGDALLWGTEPEVETAIIENSCANHTEDVVITNETETDWDNHTPSDLRAPINKKLKTTVSNPEENWSNRRRLGLVKALHTSHISKIYSDVGNLKKEYFEYALSVAKNKELRDMEEHELKKRCLNLDIDIKEAQIKRLKSDI
ncbi:hypothetical protein FQR65_LT19975 [Abscondita terminalis]|nr:hypothetical protein FQR65_LT19975 [Abscondita terminalis]